MTCTMRKSVPYSKFLIEKDAKNEAYHFILAYGLFDLFNEFHQKHGDTDHYAECVRILADKVNNTKF